MKNFFILVLFFMFCLTPVSYAAKWKEYKRKHFIVYYKEAPEDFVKTVEESAEGYYQSISKDLGFTRYKGWTWDERAKIYIYDNADDYVKSAGVAGWSHGVASPKDKVIRTFPAAHGFFDSTLPHEIGHIIFREFVGFKAQVPLWFEEGIAMYQEKARRWGAHQRVKEAIKNGSFIPLDELTLLRLNSRTNTDVVDLFYTEAASIMQYLMKEQGQHRFVRLCRKLEKGGPFEWALESVYVRFKSLKDLNKAWVAYLNKQ